MRGCAALIALAFATTMPAAAQPPPSVEVESFVAPGRVLIAMRETLDQVRIVEPDASLDRIHLDYFEVDGTARVQAVVFPPVQPPRTTSNGDIIVERGRWSDYVAEVIDGHAGSLAAAPEEPHDAPADPGSDDREIPFNAVALQSDDLAEIERVYAAISARYNDSPRLQDMLVAYTSVEVRRDQASTTATYVVFTSPTRSFTALVENGAVDTLYDGYVDPAQFLSPRYR